MASEAKSTEGKGKEGDSCKGSCRWMGALCQPGTMGGQVCDLLLWKDVPKSAIGFVTGVMFTFLVQVGGYTALTLLSYLGLLQILVCFLYINGSRFYLQFIRHQPQPKAGEDSYKPAIPKEVVAQHIDQIVASVNCTVGCGYRIIRSQDPILTIKAVLVLLVLSVIGRVFSGLTLFGLVYLAAFTLPKVYVMNKAVVDRHVTQVCAQIDAVTAKLQARLPGKKKPE